MDQLRESPPGALRSMLLVVAILPERQINNGQPSLHAHLMHHASPAVGEHVVHIGTGTGYYTAVLAHLVGPSGRVTGIEYEPELAARAKTNFGHILTSILSRATPLWFRSIWPTSFTSMLAARGRQKAGLIGSPMAGA